MIAADAGTGRQAEAGKRATRGRAPFRDLELLHLHLPSGEGLDREGRRVAKVLGDREGGAVLGADQVVDPEHLAVVVAASVREVEVVDPGDHLPGPASLGDRRR